MKLFGNKGKITVFNKGLHKGIKEEPSLKIIYVFLIIALGVSIKYEANYNERLWLILSIFLIFCSEIVNTSIETVINRISLERHILSGYAKDLAAASATLWVLFGIYVFGNWIYSKWEQHKIPINKRDNKTINIFDDKENSLMFLFLLGILALPFAYFFRLFFKFSNYIYKIL